MNCPQLRTHRSVGIRFAVGLRVLCAGLTERGTAPALAQDLDCLVQPGEVVTVGASVEGVVDHIPVERGTPVQKGTVLAVLESSAERAALAIAGARAEQMSTLEASRVRVDFGVRRKIAQLDPLRVDVVVPLALYGKIAVRQPAEVTPETPLNRARRAIVTAVGPVADAASGTFGVRLEMPNADYVVPGGLKCQAPFLPMSRPAAAPPAARPHAVRPPAPTPALPASR